jgi:hypothetical protein
MATSSGGALSGEPQSKGGLGVVFDAELDGASDHVAAVICGELQGHVDAGADAGGAVVFPVDDDAFGYSPPAT